MKYVKFILVILLGELCAVMSAQTIRYVTTLGGGDFSGSSWANASKSLQTTINSSAVGDLVFVAEGSYVGTFVLKEGVSLYGGFAGNETTVSERRLPGTGEQLTILDGDGKGRVISQVNDFNQTAVVDGFIIQKGSALSGAGVSIRTGGILRRCIIRNNTAGAISVGDIIAAQGGILYRMDRAAGLGYIMALKDHGTTFPSDRGSLLPKPTLEEAQADMATANNNKKMNNSRAARAVTEYRASAPADGFSDWLLPSAGDWSEFVTGSTFSGQRTELAKRIDEQLLLSGNFPLSKAKYWSSTAASGGKHPQMWYANLATSSLNAMSAYQYNRIRPVRTFSLSIGSGNGGGVFASGSARIEGCLVLNNSATEGSGIFAEGAVQIHYSTIVKNIQNGESNVNAEGLVMKVPAGSMEFPSCINSVVFANKNYDGVFANFEPEQVKMYYSALERADVVTGTGNINLSSDIQSANYPSFAAEALDDYRPLTISPIAAVADTRRLPSGLDSDLAGVVRVKGSNSSIGAFEAVVSSGVQDELLSAAINIYPSVLRVGEQLIVRSSNGVVLRSVSVIDLYGNEVIRRRDVGTDCHFVIHQSGVYIVRVINAVGEICVRKLVVNG